jgi:hypothetical protein
LLRGENVKSDDAAKRRDFFSSLRLFREPKKNMGDSAASYSRKRGATGSGTGAHVPVDQFIVESQQLAPGGDVPVTTGGGATTPQAMEEAYASLVRFVEDSLDLYKARNGGASQS